MGLFDERGRSAEARALEESCVIEVPYEPINKLYEENPSQLWEVVTMLVNRLRNMDEVLADSVFLDVTGRTAKRLREFSDNEEKLIGQPAKRQAVTNPENTIFAVKRFLGFRM